EEAPRNSRAVARRQRRAPLREHLHRRRGHPLPRWTQDRAEERRHRVDRSGDRRRFDDVNDLRRFARQMIVEGVGEEGQRRLAEVTARVAGSGLAHEIATSYASRAGVGTIEPGTIDPALGSAFLELEAARAVVAGSRAALAVIRGAILGGAVPSD